MKLGYTLLVIIVTIRTLLIFSLIAVIAFFYNLNFNSSPSYNGSNDLSNFFEHMSNIETVYVKDKLLLEIDVQNLDIDFESQDYDEDIVMLTLFGDSYKTKDILVKLDDGKKVVVNNKQHEKDNSPKKKRLNIILPSHFKNYVDFDIKSENGDVAFNDLVNFYSIKCNVKGGNIYGIKPKCWGEEKMETDKNHSIILKAPEKEYKIFKSFNHKEEESELNIEHA